MVGFLKGRKRDGDCQTVQRQSAQLHGRAVPRRGAMASQTVGYEEATIRDAIHEQEASDDEGGF